MYTKQALFNQAEEGSLAHTGRSSLIFQSHFYLVKEEEYWFRIGLEYVHTLYQKKTHFFHCFINRPAFSHLFSTLPVRFILDIPITNTILMHKLPLQFSHTNVPGRKYEIQCSKRSHAFDLRDLGSTWNSLVSSNANTPYFSSVFSVLLGCLCTESIRKAL